MAIGDWFTFSGRIGRQEYWLKYALLLAVVDAVGAGIDAAAGAKGILSILVGLATLVPSIAGAAKRCHDRDRSGWFQLIALIPIVGGIWLLIELGFLRGTPGPNRFGPDPLAGTRY
jgi:uncharacterized membrane protein YhaH (DUF805 family)